MSKWIWFRLDEEDSRGKITNVWHILTKDGNLYLGAVKWYGAWRKYCFYPYSSTIFEQDCLRDIANFIEDQTKSHREKRKSISSGKSLLSPLNSVSEK